MNVDDVGVDFMEMCVGCWGLRIVGVRTYFFAGWVPLR